MEDRGWLSVGLFCHPQFSIFDPQLQIPQDVRLVFWLQLQSDIKGQLSRFPGGFNSRFRLGGQFHQIVDIACHRVLVELAIRCV